MLEKLGFLKEGSLYTKTESNYTLAVDIDKKEKAITYPEDLIVNDDTTSNLEKPENFVVFECVYRLLEKGYEPSHIELEPKWQLGRDAKSGKADILIKDKNGIPYLMIECKTAGNEFKKEWNRMQNNGGQLFSYYRQDKRVKFLCLYTSDFISDEITFENYIINMQDNNAYLEQNLNALSYEKAKSEDEIFNVWSETYKKDYSQIGIFEKNVNPYEIGKNALCFGDLKELGSCDENGKKFEDGKYHEFAKILRKYNISSKENAFDKLVNLFLCKIYDETHNQDSLRFAYRGVMADTYEDLQNRLMELYKNAMKKFFNEEITFVANEDIENIFQVTAKNKASMKTLESEIKNFVKILKFYTNNDFAFLEVHNKSLFEKNAVVLLSVVKLFENLKLTQNKTNQFLGNLFELFLQKGMKQDEGQFFTPMQICEFIVYSLPLESLLKSKPKVLDYACGAGHFLNTYANFITHFIDKKEILKMHFQNIYGIEKEYRLSKVAKVSSCMYGQDEINIIFSDALATYELENKIPNDFDILIANPPYSVQGFLETLSKSSQKTYQLFTENIKEESNNAIECFFIERANQLLKGGAKVAIILPSSFLSKDSIYQRAREIIFKNFDIISIVELGSQTFGATGTNTIILFMQKRQTLPSDNKVSQIYATLNNRIQSENLANNDDFTLNGVIDSYANYQKLDKTLLESILQNNYDEKILTDSYFKEYIAPFKASSEYKKIIESKIHKETNEQEALENKKLLEYIATTEREKILYFALM